MFATEDQKAAGVDAKAVMPTIPLGTQTGTELSELQFPHLHQGFDGFNPEAFRPGAPAERTGASMDDLVAFNRASAKSHSGIWRDLAVRKRATEVDAQLGWIVKLGREAGVPIPLTECVIRQIHQIESGDRSQSWGNLEELRTFL